MELNRPVAPQHRVLRARFEIEGSDEPSLLQYREQISAATTGLLQTALEQAFAEIAGPDEVIDVRRLEVELGTINPQSLDLEALIQATRSALLTQLGDHCPRAVAPDPRRGAASTDADTDAAGPATHHSSRDEAVLSLLTYLRTGNLPTTAIHADLNSLYAVLTPSSSVAIRLVAGFHLITAQTQLVAVLSRLLATAPVTLAQAVWDAAETSQRSKHEALGAAFPLKSYSPSQLATATNQLAALLRGFHPVADHLATASPEVTTRPAPATIEPTAETQPVENAGLVLLAPYFSRLFTLCALTKNDQFISPERRAIATRLLHWVATGEAEAPEHVMIIPRLLCAVPQVQPVLALDELDPALTERAERMISAAIGHWSKLGNTSPTGLRESFLMRPGLIRRRGDQSTIAVEESGLDVLLDYVPWSFSMIALPWLAAPLTVDWR